MKRTFFTIIFSVILLFNFAFNPEKANATSTTSYKPNITTEEILQKIQKRYPKAQFINNSNAITSVTPFASAPPVTSVDTFLVFSDTGQQNTSGLLSTPLPVAGQTEVYTLIIGYGYNYPYLNDVLIPLGISENYESAFEDIDLDGDSIVDGLLYGVAFNSDDVIPNGGVYKHRAHSYNYPWNTIISTLNITHE